MRTGSKAVWNFSEHSSDLVAGPFPKGYLFKLMINRHQLWKIKQEYSARLGPLRIFIWPPRLKTPKRLDQLLNFVRNIALSWRSWKEGLSSCLIIVDRGRILFRQYLSKKCYCAFVRVCCLPRIVSVSFVQTREENSLRSQHYSIFQLVQRTGIDQTWKQFIVFIVWRQLNSTPQYIFW